ncbi:hypothetical protein BK146_17760 [Paenibacillus sp. FSL R7-0333]|nr:hypothetical protein BK146_17760 [Paenibacillus sp. FSL R7-0333]
MSLFQKFLIFKRRLSGILSDELQEAKDAFFIELTLDCERLAKRPMTGAELRMLYSLDDEQTEVLHKMISEANKG